MNASSPSSYKKIALDTNLFIYVFEQHPEFGEKAKWLLKQIEEGSYSAVASTISLTEILVKPIRDGNLALEKQYKLLFAHFPNLSVVPVDNAVAERAANTYSAAIRFLFAVTLNRTLNYLQIPRQKRRKAFPEVLTREEISTIMTGFENIKHKAMLMVVYSSGLRVSEAAALKVQHIDSKNMRVFVECGKGGKDRFTLLSETCLHVLREYWKAYRPQHPEGWLFLGYKVTPITPHWLYIRHNTLTYFPYSFIDYVVIINMRR